MRDVMLDLETMGSSPKAAIVAIGAVAFDLQGRLIGDTFYKVVDLASSMRLGGHVEASTIYWWLQQREEARAELLTQGAMQLPAVLTLLNDFIELCTVGHEKVRVWGNGSDFDNVILGGAYDRVHLQRPWKFYNNRCYRTVKNLFQDVPMAPREEGAKHIAVSDALAQTHHLLAIAEKHPLSLMPSSRQ